MDGLLFARQFKYWFWVICRYVSGLFFAVSMPLALMESTDQFPNTSTALTASTKTGLTNPGF
jgi:hypothetical protein